MWVIDQNIVKNEEIPDYKKMIESSYLYELKPEAVTV